MACRAIDPATEEVPVQPQHHGIVVFVLVDAA
jgi:hypothetical protein